MNVDFNNKGSRSPGLSKFSQQNYPLQDNSVASQFSKSLASNRSVAHDAIYESEGHSHSAAGSRVSQNNRDQTYKATQMQ